VNSSHTCAALRPGLRCVLVQPSGLRCLVVQPSGLHIAELAELPEVPPVQARCPHHNVPRTTMYNVRLRSRPNPCAAWLTAPHAANMIGHMGRLGR